MSKEILNRIGDAANLTPHIDFFIFKKRSYFEPLSADKYLIQGSTSFLSREGTSHGIGLTMCPSFSDKISS